MPSPLPPEVAALVEEVRRENDPQADCECATCRLCRALDHLTPAAPEPQTDAVLCQKCGGDGGRVLTFTAAPGITASRWCCPRCLDRMENNPPAPPCPHAAASAQTGETFACRCPAPSPPAPVEDDGLAATIEAWERLGPMSPTTAWLRELQARRRGAPCAR